MLPLSKTAMNKTHRTLSLVYFPKYSYILKYATTRAKNKKKKLQTYRMVRF